MKKYIFLATALAALVSCSENEFVGDENITNTSQNEQGAIAFGTGLKAVTRGDKTGADAAALLNNKFIVGGFKGAKGTSTAYEEGSITTEGIPTTGTVYDNYQVKWGANTAHTTTSNTAGWEYVGLDFLAPSTLVNSDNVKQTIKYWDYSSEQYDFIAYSTSDATVVTSGDPAAGAVKVTAIDAANAGKVALGAYTLRGDAAGLKKCYIADMVTAYRDDSDFDEEIEFKFRPLSAKVRIALYEIVPGYSVKNVAFYSDATTKDATSGYPSHLYTTGSDDKFNEKGSYKVYFPTIGYSNKSNTDYNKAHVVFTADTGDGTQTQDKSFGTLNYTNTGANNEGKETAEKVYLGRSSNAATYAGTADPYYSVVLPNETGAVLNLLVDYDLVSTDGSGETIHVTKASAKVPKEYATWKSGYAYTYLFKISQNGNGWTNPSAGPAGLYPITFDAVVVNDEVDNIQETITTVAEPSITTYAKGKIVTENDEYLTGNNIYVVVNKDGSNVTLAAESAKLYTVTIEAGAAQTINEASVANALVNGQKDNETTPTQWTVTDALGKKMIVKTVSGLSFPGKIAAEDAPDGNEITVNCAKFTPAVPSYDTQTPGENPSEEGLYERSGEAGSYVYTITSDTSVGDGKTYYKKTSAAGIYVFEYTYDTDKKAYKIIKIVDK